MYACGSRRVISCNMVLDTLGDRDVYIAGYARTPIGSFQGSLSSFPGTELGAFAIQAALQRSGVAPEQVEEVILGNVLSANVGQAPARQAALKAGIPNSVPCTTLNKVCSSGMKAVMLSAQAIMSGSIDVAIAGGFESMSNTPYYLSKARSGYRMGHQEVVDGMIKDGLWDPYNDSHMGKSAELCAVDHKISRKEQDDFAISSYQRAQKATEAGLFKEEIVPVSVPGRKPTDAPTIIEKDEDIYKVDFTKIPTLRPVFDKAGSVTAANASNLNDGAAALVLVSGSKAKELGLRVIAKIAGFADAAREPERFTIAPALAIPKAIEKSGLRMSDIDYFEINEAFSVVSLANCKLLDLDLSKVNINGGKLFVEKFSD